MSKYFKYAIGEILLVVIGILIALQINNWNENRKDRLKERLYLNELNQDFKSNMIQIDTILQFNISALDAMDRLFAYIEDIREKHPKGDFHNYGRSNIDSLIYYQNIAWTNKSYNPKSGTVNTLINSSAIELIKNDSLRRLLISWNDVLLDYLEEEESNVVFLTYEYSPWVRANYNFINPYSEANMALWMDVRENNYRFIRRAMLESTIKIANDEGMIPMIQEIIRLTEPENYD